MNRDGIRREILPIFIILYISDTNDQGIPGSPKYKNLY